ncbi:hypothetical protein BDZ89DRAFT_1136879 [Hymenopellis radicata]|nr:hypothetical protein BDZ89DRAFT_1136879 [Hymenopellis radicata]
MMRKKHRTLKCHPNQTVLPHKANRGIHPTPTLRRQSPELLSSRLPHHIRSRLILNCTPTPMFTTATVRAHAQTAYAQETADYFDNGGQVAFVLGRIMRES